MGSELAETDSEDVLWGVANIGWYLSAWTTGHSLAKLHVTEDELAGRTGRITATRLLTTPAPIPILHGIEPYTAMLAALRNTALHRDAVKPFPYDWRLSIEHNARELSRCAERHLAAWRAHEAWKGTGLDPADAKLTLVAHSMGGLVARYFCDVIGGANDVRRTITLGTPYYGAVKAPYILNQGRGTPIRLPRHRLRELAATMPGLYDLMPTYRCVDEQTRFRQLTPEDVEAIGGDAEQARQMRTRREKLVLTSGPALRTYVGVEQPTMQSLKIANGVVTPLYETCIDRPDGTFTRENRFGDETVYRESASLHETPNYVPQSHGALAKTEEAISYVCAVLTEREQGPPLAGALVISVSVPDVVEVGEAFPLVVHTVDDPVDAEYRIVDLSTGMPIHVPPLVRADGSVRAALRLDRSGVYRVEVKGGGFSAVTQLVMAIPPVPATGVH